MTTRYIMPRIFIVVPSAYFGQRVKILRSRNADARNQTGTVTIQIPNAARCASKPITDKRSGRMSTMSN